MRMAFLGTPAFAVPTLAELIAQGHEIAAVYSQPPRPKGRGLALEKSAVHHFAEAEGLEVRTPDSLKSADEQLFFADLELDAVVVVAYGLLLPKPVLEAPMLGCFNLHASLLPRWRGAAPIQRAVMACDAETGVVVMRMDQGLDTGAVLMAERVAIGRQTSGELTERLARLGADLMVRAMSALERGAIAAEPQAERGVTYAKKINKDEARIDWSKSAREVDCLIRGLSPSPGAFSEIKGERLKILYAEPIDGKGSSGEVISDDLIVACGEGALRLLKVQRAGGKAMAAEELLKGFALPRGARFS
ncbi:MAG TPA: methionyl-tRNA formyltransferase [Rhizomicrobium sp.]|nr:methionyl-tRNA formyltransferase [Rhizomicrobium sp.]